MAQTTKTILADYQDIAHQVAKSALRANAIFAPGGSAYNRMDVANQTGGKGLTGRFGRFSETTASQVGEGADFANFQALTPTTSDVTATRFMAGNEITFEAYKDTIDPLNIIARSAEDCGKALATKMNQEVCAAFSSFTTTVGSTGVDITNANIKTAINTLEAADIVGPYSCVISHQQWFNLISETDSPLIDASKTQKAEGVYNSWFVDDIYNVQWYVTSDCTTANAGADDLGAMFGPQAVGFVLGKEIELYEEWQQLRHTWEITSASYFGVGIVDTASGVKLVTDTA